MKHPLLSLLAIPASLALAAIAHGGESAWTPLFNGRNLDGWVSYGGKAPFVAKDGEIVGTFVKEGVNTFLATTAEYDDFIFEVEFLAGDENSGVQFRSHTRPENGILRVTGYQAEIDPREPAKIGSIYEEADRAWLQDLRKTETGTKAAAVFKSGEWNTLRIEAIGDRLRTWLNETPIADLRDSASRSGFIALQVHAVAESHGKTMRFKSPRIKIISP